MGKSPVLITRNGRAVALLIAVPEDEDERDSLLLAHNPKLRSYLSEAYARVKAKGGTPFSDFRRQIEAMDELKEADVSPKRTRIRQRN